MRRLTTEPSAVRLATLAEALASLPAPASAASPPRPDDSAHAEQQQHRAFEAAMTEARREGFEKGLADAEAVIERRVAEVASKLQAEQSRAMAAIREHEGALATARSALYEAIGRHRQASEEAAVEGAYAALIRVLGLKAADRMLVGELCAEILQQRGIGPVTLRLAPADCALVEPTEGVRIQPDPTLAPGQCVLESPRGGSDTGLDVRLTAIRDAFLGALSTHRSVP